MSNDSPILLYDGHCALCNGWVKFVLWADRHGPLRFAALTSDTGQEIVRRHPELAVADSLVFARADRVAIRSTAVLDLLDYLGGFWRIPRAAARLIPREIRDSLYDVVAFWRYRLFGRYPACPLPRPEVRARFLP